jgi:DNA-binding protein HU-beta
VIQTNLYQRTFLEEVRLNKSDLVKVIADAGELSNAAAGRVLDAILESVVKAVSKGDSVVLTGFGTFESTKRAARTGRNPQTNEPIQIPAATLPRFKAGKGFKDAVNVKTSKKKK